MQLDQIGNLEAQLSRADERIQAPWELWEAHASHRREASASHGRPQCDIWAKLSQTRHNDTPTDALNYNAGILMGLGCCCRRRVTRWSMQWGM